MASALICFSVKKGCFSFVVAVVAVFTVVLSSVYGQEAAAVQDVESPRSPQAEASDPEKATLRGEPAELTGIQASPESVELTFSAPVQFHSATLRGGAEQAGRFYIDVFPASLTPRRRSPLEITTGPVRRVRTSLFRAGVVRVVFDLREECNFQVATLTEPSRLVITAQRKNAATSHSQPAAPTIGTKQTSNSSEKSVEKKQVRSQTFPDVEWQVMSQPWTLMLHSRSTAIDTAFSQALPVTAMDTASQMNPDAIEPGFSRQANEFEEQVSIFSSGGGEWDVVCRDGGCVRLTARDGEEVDINPVREQQEEAKTTNTEEEQQVASASDQPKQETIRTGGTIMGELWMAAMTAGVFLSFLAGIGVVVLWNLRKRGASTEKSDGWEGRMAYLEEAVNRAGMLNNSFFHSLEVSQKRLEALLTHADVTEQNLRRLLHQAAFTGERSTGRSADALATATLLLSEGEEVQQVARLLRIPVAQVRLLQEIRESTQKEKSAGASEKATDHSPLAGVTSSLSNLATRLNEATRNGTHLAQNEQSL